MHVARVDPVIWQRLEYDQGAQRDVITKEYYEGDVRHNIKWWDEDRMDKDECTPQHY